MGVFCQILLNRPHDGFFRSGQILTGTMNYIVEKPTRYDSIDISFVGKGRCDWREGSSNNRRSYDNKEKYFSIEQNIYKAKCDEKLKPGDFDYPFEFIVPYDIPSSLKNDICTIEYKVIVKFAKQRLFNCGDRFETEVPIRGCVSSSLQEPLFFELIKKPFSIESKSKVRVNGVIDRVLVAPGENFNLRLFVYNDSYVSIVVKTELLTYFTYISSCEHEMVVTEPLDATRSISTKIKGGSKTELVYNVPTLKSLYSIQHTKILTGEYKVRVMVKLPFPNDNAAVEIPVVVGEKGVPPQVTVPLDLEKPSTSCQITEKCDKQKHTQSDDFENYNKKLKPKYGSEKSYEKVDDDSKTYFEKLD